MSILGWWCLRSGAPWGWAARASVSSSLLSLTQEDKRSRGLLHPCLPPSLTQSPVNVLPGLAPEDARGHRAAGRGGWGEGARQGPNAAPNGDQGTRQDQEGSRSKSCRCCRSGASAVGAAQKKPSRSQKSATRGGCLFGHHSLLLIHPGVPRDSHTQQICQFGGSPGDGLLLGQALGLIT